MTLEYRCSECGARLQTSAVQPEAAALIDAATDMLEALHSARRAFEDEGYRGAARDIVNDAIAKATQLHTSAMRESK